ncbi:MAG TPA: alpha/beta hydrolase [Acidimicrobiales bacterium]|nr:alpha/beta hydrolase [Acidimicrobiales bacterium]
MSKVLVFVGGLAAPGNEWPLTPIRRSARKQGWRTKYFNERLVFGPLATSAERLVELIDELDQIHDTIVVVGHSMGGLVAEHAAALGAPIDGLVTIGTPHRGHYLSRFGPLPVMREMGTNSAYLRAVAAIPGERPPILVVTAAKDRLVAKGAARPNRPHTFLEVPNVGHLSVIFDQSTANAILKWADALTDEIAQRHQDLDRTPRSGRGPNSPPL